MLGIRDGAGQDRFTFASADEFGAREIGEDEIAALTVTVCVDTVTDTIDVLVAAVVVAVIVRATAVLVVVTSTVFAVAGTATTFGDAVTVFLCARYLEEQNALAGG